MIKSFKYNSYDSKQLHFDLPKKHNFNPKKKDLKLSKLRSSARWQKLRSMILRHHPLCFFCEKPAYQIHHIVQASNDISLFFKIENLMPLCDKCHIQVDGAYKRGINPEELFPLNERLSLCQE